MYNEFVITVAASIRCIQFVITHIIITFNGIRAPFCVVVIDNS